MTSTVYWRDVSEIPKEGERYLVRIRGSNATITATYYKRIYGKDRVWLSDSSVELDVVLWAKFPITIDP